ncbi:MAG: hypothetical protein MJE77_13600 [Proteobacteria bacterium]|nr:hypothetical protein [Pseudomonadota bacterium]
MNFERMLEKCRRGQWSIDQIDWTRPARPMGRTEELAVVQYFVNMAGIERLAKALFEEQRRRTRDPVLADIFTTFIADEERHAVAAGRLAEYYDVHRYKTYRLDPALVRFRPAFIEAIRAVSAEFANMYITTGELLLDTALLRALSDYVDDSVCSEVMRLINRDESRHIAIDYHMVGYYASAGYQAWLRTQPRKALSQHIVALWTFARVLYHASPFVRRIFVEPITHLDPSRSRMREAFKRIQILGRKPEVASRPFTRFLRVLQLAYDSPVIGSIFGRLLTRTAGVPGHVLTQLYSESEVERACGMTYDELAREAVASYP